MAKARRVRTRVAKPCILIVDDVLEEAEAKRLMFSSAGDVLPRTPGDVTAHDLRRADVVLIDFALDGWELDATRPIAERPINGVALAAVFRSHSTASSQKAFALHSGRLDGLSGGLPPASHLHLIARSNNLEWVFSKTDTDNARPLQEQVLSLARALHQLPPTWPVSQPTRIRKNLEDLLKIPARAAWRDRAWKHVEDCHPPIHELSPPTHGLAFVRWLLHSILPYATFLWDFRYLAARLRVTPRSLAAALNRSDSFAKTLASFKYTGVLRDFVGQRWWRPGIEHWLWDLTDANTFDAETLSKIMKRLSRHLEPISLREPVVVFDAELRPTDDLTELSEAVELQPDDWPPYAGRPWARRDLAAATPRLRALIAPTSAP
jgi:hypothetical protein